MEKFGKYYFGKCDEEFLNKYKNRGEIDLFEFGCGEPSEENGYQTTFYICSDSEANDVVAFITLSSHDEIIYIDEFEVIKSRRRNGLGIEIISGLQCEENTSSFKAIPISQAAKKFWISCGFHEQEDEYLIWHGI